jgi:osmotically-inducible protein OsmY
MRRCPAGALAALLSWVISATPLAAQAAHAVSYELSDGARAGRIRAALCRELGSETIRELRVTVNRRAATIAGRIGSDALRARAAAVAAEEAGIDSVSTRDVQVTPNALDAVASADPRARSRRHAPRRS